MPKKFLLPTDKRSTLKGKNLLPLGANSFLLEWTLFQKGLGEQECKQEVTKVVSLVKHNRNSHSLNTIASREVLEMHSLSLKLLISPVFITEKELFY